MITHSPPGVRWPTEMQHRHHTYRYKVIANALPLPERTPESLIPRCSVMSRAAERSPTLFRTHARGYCNRRFRHFARSLLIHFHPAKATPLSVLNKAAWSMPRVMYRYEEWRRHRNMHVAQVTKPAQSTRRWVQRMTTLGFANNPYVEARRTS